MRKHIQTFNFSQGLVTGAELEFLEKVPVNNTEHTQAC